MRRNKNETEYAVTIDGTKYEIVFSKFIIWVHSASENHYFLKIEIMQHFRELCAYQCLGLSALVHFFLMKINAL